MKGWFDIRKYINVIKKIFLTFIHFLRERETEHEQERGRERETQNLKQAPGCALSAQSPTRGSNSQTARSPPEPKSDAQPTEPPRRPYFSFLVGSLSGFGIKVILA